MLDFITESRWYKVMMPKLYGLGAAIVILGALFKIEHLPGASIMLILGLGTEAVIFFFSAFETPKEEPDWSLVYPELAHMKDPDSDFPKIRVWGTIGWIAASWAFPMIWLQTDLNFQWMPPFIVGPEVANVTNRLADALIFSGVISVTYGLFCFMLPNTPPKKDAVEKLAFKKAFALFNQTSFTILVVASLTVSIIHQIYFLQTGPFLSSIGLKDSQIGPAMTVGQFAEIAAMAYLGFFLKRFGFRKVIFLGVLAYAARYAVFGTVTLPIWIMVVSQAFHGICYAFFFAGAYIYVDKIADEDVRHSAQTVFGMIILGGGPVIGGWLSGYLQETFTQAGLFDYSPFWYTLSAVGFITALFFGVMFREQVEEKAEA